MSYRISSEFILNFGNQTDLYYKLLSEEDFDFKSKDIKTEILFIENNIKIKFFCNSIIELKIANTALIRSLEIIEKTINI